MVNNSPISISYGYCRKKGCRLVLILSLSLFLSGISYTHSARAYWPAVFHPDNLPMLMDGCTVGASVLAVGSILGALGAAWHVCQTGLTYNREYERQRVILEDPLERFIALNFHPELWMGSSVEERILDQINSLSDNARFAREMIISAGEKEFREKYLSFLMHEPDGVQRLIEKTARLIPEEGFFVDNRAQQRARVDEMWSHGYSIGSNAFYAVVAEGIRRQVIMAYRYISGALPFLRKRYNDARRRPFPRRIRDQISALQAAAREAERDRERVRARGRRDRGNPVSEQREQEAPGLQTNPISAALSLPSVVVRSASANLRRFYSGSEERGNHAQAVADQNGVVLTRLQPQPPAVPNPILPLPGIDNVRTGKDLAKFIRDTDGLAFKYRGGGRHSARIVINGAANVPIPSHYANALRNLRPDQVRYCVNGIKTNCGYF